MLMMVVKDRGMHMYMYMYVRDLEEKLEKASHEHACCVCVNTACIFVC